MFSLLNHDSDYTSLYFNKQFVKVKIAQFDIKSIYLLHIVTLWIEVKVYCEDDLQKQIELFPAEFALDSLTIRFFISFFVKIITTLNNLLFILK